MKIALLTVDGFGFPIAYHLQEEGHEVYVGQVSDWADVKVNVKEKPKDRDKRFQIYDGLFEHRMPIEKLMAFLLRQKPQDWFILCDFNWMWPYADRLLQAGFRGLLPHREDYMLEHDRSAMRDLVEKLYPDVETGDYQEFKKPKDGILFLENADDKDYILKGFNAEADTILPDNDDIAINRDVLISALEHDKDHLYEKDGFILEEIIHDAIEFTPEAYAFDGEVRSISVDVEHKRLGSRSGPMTGCALGCVMWQDMNAKLYDMFLRPLEERMLRPNEFTVWDLSILYSPKDNKFYAGEFCPNRLGYDAVLSEIATYGSVTAWLESIMGADHPKAPLAVSLRVFNIDKKEQLFVGDPADPNIWCYDVCDRGGELYTAGIGKDAYVLTQPGDNIGKAISELYSREQGTEFLDGYFLQENDWYDLSYHCNVLNRIEVLQKLGLIQLSERKPNARSNQTERNASGSSQKSSATAATTGY